MEQLVARWAHNPKVVGSSPAPATLDPLKSLISEGFSFSADKTAGKDIPVLLSLDNTFN